MNHEFTPINLGIDSNKDFVGLEMRLEKPESVEDSEQLISEQIDELTRLKEEAREAGRLEGLAQAEAEIEAKRAELANWLDLVRAPVQLVDEQLVSEMITAIVWLARACIGLEIKQNPEQLRAVIETIKEEWEEIAGPKTLHMNPEDIDWIKSNLAKDKALINCLLPDEQLGPGDFYLSGENSELDGRLFARLATLFSQHIDKDNLLAQVKAASEDD